MRLSKKDFIKIMEEFKEVIDDTEGVNIAMKKLSPDFGGFYNGRVEFLLTETLETMFNDKSEWISYYIYELNWGKEWKEGCVTMEGKDVKMKTIEDLHNILINNI